MKRLIFSGIFATALVILSHAQTVDEIINKHITAMGGKEKMISLKTLKMTSSVVNAQGDVVSLVLTAKHLVGFRTDRNNKGTKSWSIVTPKKGWVLPPGQTVPREMAENNFKINRTKYYR